MASHNKNTPAPRAQSPLLLALNQFSPLLCRGDELESAEKNELFLFWLTSVKVQTAPDEGQALFPTWLSFLHL
jgi:hypothetical protein